MTHATINTPKNIRLITLEMGPFVQPTLITLSEKSVVFEIENIDLHNRPDWFVKLSPTGQVPLLEVDGELLFEGAVITQYLDEVYAPHFQPALPLQRARHQSWAAFGLMIIRNLFSTYMAKDAETYRAGLAAMLANLARVEAELGDGPYFSGSKIALVDFSYAPLFLRLAIFDRTYNLGILDRFPRVSAWAKVLRARPSTQNSVPDTFEAHYLARITNKQSYVASMAG